MCECNAMPKLDGAIKIMQKDRIKNLFWKSIEGMKKNKITIPKEKDWFCVKSQKLNSKSKKCHFMSREV